jgi:regulator of protease activity HflC (stomatin/prohibitin superfamily)
VKGGLIAGFVVLIAAGAGIWYWMQWDRVDPGNAGVKINYCNGTQQTITDSRYVWVDWRCERLAEYPTAEYTIDMINRGQQGNDSVPCVMKDQQSINMDSSTAWSVDPARVGDLYRMRPNVALSNSGGQDIATLVVRSEVRAGIRDACTLFGWEEAYGSRRAEYEAAAEKAVLARLEPVGIKVRTVSIRDMDPSQALDALIAARLKGQQEIESAMFQQQQAERAGAAEVAKARAAAQLQEEQSKAALVKARADADQAEVATRSEAARIRALAEAESEANRARAASITPSLVEYEKWKRWNGQMPSTVLGSDPSMRVDIPVTPAAASR